jgi:hypothetical protein
VTLVVEDGSIVAGAESYASVAYADAYFAAQGEDPAAWLGAAASGKLVVSAVPSDSETVVIDGKTYTFETALTDSDGNVQIGLTVAESLSNLEAALSLGDGAGTAYASSTTAHPTVQSAGTAGSVLWVVAISRGTAGNSIAVSETLAGASSAWTAAALAGGLDPTITTLAKENLLRIGTRFLDLTYSTRWKGSRTDVTQVLDWPRVGVIQEDYQMFDEDEIPPAILDATCEAALRQSTQEGGLMPDIASPGTVASKSVAAGPLKSSTTYLGGLSQIPRFRKIDELVIELVWPPGRIVRG